MKYKNINKKKKIIDDWDLYSIDFVRISVYNETKEVQYAVFKALNTDSTSWMTQANLIQSSWTDIQQHTTKDFGIR